MDYYWGYKGTIFNSKHNTQRQHTSLLTDIKTKKYEDIKYNKYTLNTSYGGTFIKFKLSYNINGFDNELFG